MPDEIKEDVKKDVPVIPTEDVSFIGNLKMRNRLFNPNTPLFLPDGSVRAMIVIVLVWLSAYCTIKGIVLTDRMWDLILGFTSMYIGSRLNFKGKGDEKTDA